MTKSDSIKNLAKALQDFHREMGVIAKTAENPFFKSKYADLGTILTAIKEPLQKAGLTFSQFPEDQSKLTSIVMHPESGEWIEGTYSMPPAKQDPQGYGSAITYQRRYALGAILGLNLEEDDDANASSQNPASYHQAPSTPAKTYAPAPTGKPASEKQKTFISKLIAEKGQPEFDPEWYRNLDMNLARNTIDRLMALPSVEGDTSLNYEN